MYFGSLRIKLSCPDYQLAAAIRVPSLDEFDQWCSYFSLFEGIRNFYISGLPNRGGILQLCWSFLKRDCSGIQNTCYLGPRQPQRAWCVFRQYRTVVSQLPKERQELHARYYICWVGQLLRTLCILRRYHSLIVTQKCKERYISWHGALATSKLDYPDRYSCLLVSPIRLPVAAGEVTPPLLTLSLESCRLAPHCSVQRRCSSFAVLPHDLLHSLWLCKAFHVGYYPVPV